MIGRVVLRWSTATGEHSYTLEYDPVLGWLAPMHKILQVIDSLRFEGMLADIHVAHEERAGFDESAEWEETDTHTFVVEGAP